MSAGTDRWSADGLGLFQRVGRALSREGMVSVGGTFYSVLDATHRRALEVHTLAEEIRIFEDGVLIAAHPVLDQRARPSQEPAASRPRSADGTVVLTRAGDLVAQRWFTCMISK